MPLETPELTFPTNLVGDLRITLKHKRDGASHNFPPLWIHFRDCERNLAIRPSINIADIMRNQSDVGNVAVLIPPGHYNKVPCHFGEWNRNA
jgi:hypothetical protein